MANCWRHAGLSIAPEFPTLDVSHAEVWKWVSILIARWKVLSSMSIEFFFNPVEERAVKRCDVTIEEQIAADFAPESEQKDEDDLEVDEVYKIIPKISDKKALCLLPELLTYLEQQEDDFVPEKQALSGLQRRIFQKRLERLQQKPIEHWFSCNN